jgi:hypothetical protein
MKQNNLYTWNEGKLYPFIQMDIDPDGLYGVNICANRRTNHRGGVWVPSLVLEENSLYPAILNNYPWTFLDDFSELATNVNMFKMLETGYIVFAFPEDGGNDDGNLETMGLMQKILFPDEASQYVPHLADTNAFESLLDNPDTITYPNTDHLLKDITVVRIFTKSNSDGIQDQKDCMIIGSHTLIESLRTFHGKITNHKHTETLVAMPPNSKIDIAFYDEKDPIKDNVYEIRCTDAKDIEIKVRPLS